MLHGLHLAPNLEKIVLHFFISSSARAPAASTSIPLDAMLDDLQCLAERPENLERLTLTLTLYCDPSLPPKRSFSARALTWRRQKSIQNKAPMFSPSLAIAASLECIQTVVLNTRSASMVQALLPWLAALPALDELEVFVLRGRTEVSEAAEMEMLEKEAREVLRGEIHLRVGRSK
uniref:Uncharacterized protein n=1 Tax=Mycena chlorophos TaxID=658473 RepID=A0ABQ0LT73_MYCCL|nr:predicted protein [Mycena chlorophos]